jgi:hypothetical protein
MSLAAEASGAGTKPVVDVIGRHTTTSMTRIDRDARRDAYSASFTMLKKFATINCRAFYGLTLSTTPFVPLNADPRTTSGLPLLGTASMSTDTEANTQIDGGLNYVPFWFDPFTFMISGPLLITPRLECSLKQLLVPGISHCWFEDSLAVALMCLLLNESPRFSLKIERNTVSRIRPK